MIRGAEELYALSAAPPELRPEVRRFYFVRHGETAGNATFIVQSPVIPLNETGRAQAARAAERLADAGRDHAHRGQQLSARLRDRAGRRPPARHADERHAPARRTAVRRTRRPERAEARLARTARRRRDPAGFRRAHQVGSRRSAGGAPTFPASLPMAAISACSWPPSAQTSATSSRRMRSRSASTARTPAGR